MSPAPGGVGGAGSDALADALVAGERWALARAITLAESTRSDHRARAEAVLSVTAYRAGSALRLGLSGAPGVGKSTLIEALGRHLIGRGRRVAVLAVDPSSPVSGGSILGDKTRMVELARDPAAFVRPSPAGDASGGVARRTREAMLLAAAAGYDPVIVETVGVGQAETAVAGMVDLFVLLVAPGGGDELQGLKKGVVELADLVVVTKSDGDLLAAAGRTAADYRAALALLRGEGGAVTACSAMTGAGVAELWDAVAIRHQQMVADGTLVARRARQSREWLWQEIVQGLRERFSARPEIAAELPRLEEELRAGRVDAAAAARLLLDRFEEGGSRR